ncbi:hypothetical protein CLU79DRAFT_734528 [Phycomyces nitens]|nr:hypothetical protein CLU79DRAFT_734528 [Phycomyces nitens]
MAKYNTLYTFLALCGGMAAGSTVVHKIMKPDLVCHNLLSLAILILFVYLFFYCFYIVYPSTSATQGNIMAF